MHAYTLHSLSNCYLIANLCNFNFVLSYQSENISSQLKIIIKLLYTLQHTYECNDVMLADFVCPLADDG